MIKPNKNIIMKTPNQDFRVNVWPTIFINYKQHLLLILESRRKNNIIIS
jgi:hypothetical protein